MKKDIGVFYISDIHLDYKLLCLEDELFYKKKKIIEDAKKDYIDFLAHQLSESLNKKKYKENIVLILGDTSCELKSLVPFLKQFMKEVDKTTTKVFYVLGNHEYWFKKAEYKTNNVDEIVFNYKNTLKDLGIILLEKSVYIPNSDNEIYVLNELSFMSNSQIKELFKNAKYAIIGGTGFAGLNDYFNVYKGIYRDANIDRDYEIKLSNTFSLFHRLINENAPNTKVIVATHNPVEDWCEDELNPNYIYTNGHTHTNKLVKDKDKTIYADNQIGYESDKVEFKVFEL